MRARFGFLNSIGLVATLLAACRGHNPPALSVVPLAPNSCAVLPDSGSMPRRLMVAFTDSASLRQIAARHFYEPLIRLTCDGEPVPALARSWTTRDGGRSWMFTLR